MPSPRPPEDKFIRKDAFLKVRSDTATPGKKGGLVRREQTPVVPVTSDTFLNRPAFEGRFVGPGTIGVPLQFPDIPIPDGFALVIKARAAISTSRFRIADNGRDTIQFTTSYEMFDKEIVRLYVTNANVVWGTVDANGDGWHILVEQDTPDQPRT